MYSCYSVFRYRSIYESSLFLSISLLMLSPSFVSASFIKWGTFSLQDVMTAWVDRESILTLQPLIPPYLGKHISPRAAGLGIWGTSDKQLSYNSLICLTPFVIWKEPSSAILPLYPGCSPTSSTEASFIWLSILSTLGLYVTKSIFSPVPSRVCEPFW